MKMSEQIKIEIEMEMYFQTIELKKKFLKRNAMNGIAIIRHGNSVKRVASHLK